MELKFSFNLDFLPEKKGVYLVGGTVRDMLLGQPPEDFDIAVDGQPENFAEKMAILLSTRPIRMGKPGKEAIRIVSKGIFYDIVRLNGATIDDDLKMRDFTVNAMAFSLRENQLIDPLQGRRDLYDGIIRMVSASSFKNDPIRLLRAFRFAAALDFIIEPHTLKSLCKNAVLIRTSAGERIRAELFKLLESDQSYPCIRGMESTGLLYEIFPALKGLAGCRQNRHHAFDVFEHTLSAYQAMEYLFNNLSEIVPEPAFSTIHSMGKKKRGLLKYALLLHDIGKPSAASEDASGNIHFYGHGQKSAAISKTIGETLRLSVEEMNYVTKIISNHNHPRHLFALEQKKQLSSKAKVRFFLACGSLTPDILVHSIADHLGKGLDRENGFIAFALQLIQDYLGDYNPKKSGKPYITGYDLIYFFGLTPSPLFRKTLAHIEEGRLTGEIQTRQEALSRVKHFLASQNNSKA